MAKTLFLCVMINNINVSIRTSHGVKKKKIKMHQVYITTESYMYIN